MNCVRASMSSVETGSSSDSVTILGIGAAEHP